MTPEASESRNILAEKTRLGVSNNIWHDYFIFRFQ